MPTAGGERFAHEQSLVAKLLDITSDPEQHRARLKELSDLLDQTNDRLAQAHELEQKNVNMMNEIMTREKAVAGREAVADQREKQLGEVGALWPQLAEAVNKILPKINAFNTSGQSGQWRAAGGGPSASKTTGQV